MRRYAAILLGIVSIAVTITGCEREEPQRLVRRSRRGTPAKQITPEPGGAHATLLEALRSAQAPTRSIIPTGDAPWLEGKDEGLKPTLLVGNFKTESEDGHRWGRLFSECLKIKLHYAPHELFSMPPTEHVQDQYRYLNKRPYTSDEWVGYDACDAVWIARVLGVKNVITGTVTKRGDSLSVAVELRDAKTSEVLSRFTLDDAVDRVPQMLVDGANRIVDASGVEVDDSVRQYLARLMPGTGQSFRDSVVFWDDLPSSPAQKTSGWTELYEKDPNNCFAGINATYQRMWVKRDDAITEARQHLEAEPGQGQLWLSLIATLCACDRHEETIEECSAFLRENPNDLRVMHYLAEAYRAAGQHAKCIATAERMVQLNPNNSMSHFQLALAISDYGWAMRGGGYWRSVPPEGKVIFPVAMKEARKAFERALTINPDNADLLAEFAYNSGSTGSGTRAVESLCRKAIARQPDHYRARSVLLWWYRPGYTNQHNKAMQLCRKAAEDFPENPRMQWLTAEYLLWYIAKNHSQTGRTYEDFQKIPEITKAIEISMDKALALTPEAIDWHHKAGEYYLFKSDWEKAWFHFSNITDLPTEFRRNRSAEHEYWRDRAMAAARVKRWDQALEYAKKGMSLRPCRVCRGWMLGIQGWAYREKDDYDKALENFELVIKQKLNLLGWAYAEYAEIVILHRPALKAKGWEYAQKAVETEPKKAARRVVLARYHMERKEITKAREQIRTALKLDPDCDEARKLKEENPGIRW